MCSLHLQNLVARLNVPDPEPSVGACRREPAVIKMQAVYGSGMAEHFPDPRGRGHVTDPDDVVSATIDEEVGFYEFDVAKVRFERLDAVARCRDLGFGDLGFVALDRARSLGTRPGHGSAGIGSAFDAVIGWYKP